MADNYLRPGVYVNEAPAAASPIQSASTAVAGVLGITQRGIPGVPLAVNSWNDLVRKFAQGLTSPFYASGYLAYAMFGFFNNGGAQSFVQRVVGSGSTAASVQIKDNSATPATVLTFTASGVADDGTVDNDPGIWGNGLAVVLSANAKNASNYDVQVNYNGTTVETWTNCSLNSTDTNFIQKVINGNSAYVSVTRQGTTTPNPANLGTSQAFTGGADVAPVASDFVSAFANFSTVQDQITLLACPDNGSATVIEQGYATAKTYNAFYVADSVFADTPASVQTTRASLSSDHAELHFPWILVNDPISTNPANPTKYVPASGHVLGAYARTDKNRGTFKAPAGTSDGQLVGALGVSYTCTPTDEANLNSNNINVIRAIKNSGVVLFGARVLDTSMQYVPVRRELSKIERAVKDGTQWAVFEPNNSTLWRKVTNGVRAYLFGEFEAGAFAGVKPDGSDSFFVTCDSTNNTTTTIAQGQVNIQIGVALTKPGEFVIFNVAQVTPGSF